MTHNIQMIQESAQSYDQKRKETAQANLGECIENLRAFTHIARMWFLKISESLPLKDVLDSNDPDVERLNAIRSLTNTVLKTARDIPTMLAVGTNTPMVTAWRLITEAKNDAMFIQIDKTGEAAKMWFLFQATKVSIVDPENETYQGIAKWSKKELESRGEKPRNAENWAKTSDEKIYTNNVDRCDFVWRNKKSTKLLTEDEKKDMANQEKRMLQEANAMAHANVYRGEIGINFFQYMPSILRSTMETVVAYKNAANFLMGIPEDIEEEDFTTYPDSMWETRRLSKLVIEMYSHTSNSLEERMKKPIESYRDPVPTLHQQPSSCSPISSEEKDIT